MVHHKNGVCTSWDVGMLRHQTLKMLLKGLWPRLSLKECKHLRRASFPVYSVYCHMFLELFVGLLCLFACCISCVHCVSCLELH